MTYQELCARLERAGIENAKWDAELLLEHFCNAGRQKLLLFPDRDYDTPELEKAVRRREKRYPLQYLIGEWQFYRQTYEVSPDCLIPRSDTEILVEEAVKKLPKNACFADLCTGSGCIAISILAERPDTRAVAVEKFPRTLELAKRNAVRNGVADRLDAVCADVLEPEFLPSDLRFDAILSNPPYIQTAVLRKLAPELSAEPAAALDGGEDGLIFYRKILENTSAHLKPNGFYLFEIGFDQAEALTQIGKQAGFCYSRVLRDYGGNDRAVWLERQKIEKST